MGNYQPSSYLILNTHGTPGQLAFTPDSSAFASDPRLRFGKSLIRRVWVSRVPPH